MPLQLAADNPWYIDLLKDSGPVVVAGALLIIGLIVLYKYAGKPSLEMLRDITKNCTRAANSNESAAQSNSAAATVMGQNITKLTVLADQFERQLNRMDAKP